MKCSIPLLMPAMVALAVVPAVESALPPPMAHDAAQRLFESWKTPVPARHLVGNVYYVGASGVSSFLITTPEGHILLDTGFPETVPIIARGVEQLGFRLGDIRLILSSHAHVDHVGGHAEIKRRTGAAVVASTADAEVLASGGRADFSPFPRELMRYEPVQADRIVADGEKVTLGGVTLTAHLTPGHTRGATTWTMDATEGGRVYHVVFFSSASIAPGTRLTGEQAAYPGIAADLERTWATLRALPCDIFLAPHGGQFAMAEKFARLDRGEGAAALVDPAGWREMLASGERALREQLAAEQSEEK